MIRTVFDNVTFIEGAYPTAKPIKPVSVRIYGSLFSQAQLKSLDDVKREMAILAKNSGGNAIVQFTYGQRSNFWTALFSFDNVSWYGEGIIVKI